MIPTDKWVRKHVRPHYVAEGRNGYTAVDLYTDAGCMNTVIAGCTSKDGHLIAGLANDAVWRGKMAILRDLDPQQLIGILEQSAEQLDGWANEIRGDGGEECLATAAERDAGMLIKLANAIGEEL